MTGRVRLGFAPDAALASRLDARMRTRLGESLRYVLEQARDVLDPPPGFDGLLARLAEGPVDPQAFGAYYELVMALEAGDLDLARELLDTIVAAPAMAPAELPVRALEDPETSAWSRRYCRLVDTDPQWPLEIGVPEAALVATTRRRIDEALALLASAHPELLAELRALIREVVLARAARPVQGETFDGVSSFMLWGGLVLHAGSHETRLEMVEALAHESAHSLLFGLAVDGPLLENDDRERFSSPLRSDPRPLDGIYHATFVTARMHHALRHLRDVGALGAADQAWVASRLETHVKHFEEGLAVVDRHARPTPVGAAALDAARDYMASA